MTAGPLWDPAGGHEVVVDERHVTPGRDWASGYTKLQCPDGHFLTGYSVRGSAVSAALCAAAPTGAARHGRPHASGSTAATTGARPPRAATSRTATTRASAPTDEYAAGIAYTGRVGSARTPDALYCRKLG